MESEREGEDRVWMAYNNGDRILKVLFEGFGMGLMDDFTEHTQYEEFSKAVTELAEKVFEL